MGVGNCRIPAPGFWPWIQKRLWHHLTALSGVSVPCKLRGLGRSGSLSCQENSPDHQTAKINLWGLASRFLSVLCSFVVPEWNCPAGFFDRRILPLVPHALWRDDVDGYRGLPLPPDRRVARRPWLCDWQQQAWRTALLTEQRAVAVRQTVLQLLITQLAISLLWQLWSGSEQGSAHEFEQAVAGSDLPPLGCWAEVPRMFSLGARFYLDWWWALFTGLSNIAVRINLEQEPALWSCLPSLFFQSIPKLLVLLLSWQTVLYLHCDY